MLALYPDGVDILVNNAGNQFYALITLGMKENLHQFVLACGIQNKLLSIQTTVYYISPRHLLDITKRKDEVKSITLKVLRIEFLQKISRSIFEGVPGRGLIENLTTKVWQDTLAVNLTAPFVLTRTFFPLMKKRGWGRIINMSSQMGQLGELGKLAYCSSKSALIGFSRVVALEGAQHGVTSNAVCPGFVDAPMCHSFITQVATQQGLSFEDIKYDFLKDGTPIGRLIPISEVAGLVTFLCSDVASSITGSPIAIDGGFAAR